MFGYYKDLFALIQKHAKEQFFEEKKELLAKRRELLKEGQMKEYKEMVKRMISREEQVFGELLEEALNHLGYNEQEFMQMHQTFMMNPQT